MGTLVKKGDTFRRVLSLTYDQTGTSVDLSGCTAYSQLRAEPENEVLADATTAIDTSLGQITVTYTADQIDALEPGEYGYDVRITKDNDVLTVWTERISVFLPYTELGGA